MRKLPSKLLRRIVQRMAACGHRPSLARLLDLASRLGCGPLSTDTVVSFRFHAGLARQCRPFWNLRCDIKNVPQEIIGKLNAALADEALRSRLVDLGYEVYPRERQRCYGPSPWQRLSWRSKVRPFPAQSVRDH
jgi:hypothetical protein